MLCGITHRFAAVRLPVLTGLFATTKSRIHTMLVSLCLCRSGSLLAHTFNTIYLLGTGGSPRGTLVEGTNYSSPHAGLADIYQLSERPQLAREEVQKALNLDDQSADAHNSLANMLYLFDRDWEGAEREFKRALEFDHNYPPAHHWYSMYLALKGRKEEALAEAGRRPAVALVK